MSGSLTGIFPLQALQVPVAMRLSSSTEVLGMHNEMI